MFETVSFELLQQVTNETLLIYQAFNRAQILTGEGKKILAMADELLLKTGLEYLNSDSTIQLKEKPKDSEKRGCQKKCVNGLS